MGLKQNKNKIKIIDKKAYVIPLIMIFVFFALAGLLLTNSISDFITEKMISDSKRMASYNTSRLSNSVAAINTINDLLDDKLLATNDLLIKNKNMLSNDYLRELAEDMHVDSIHWYNKDGKIIYTDQHYMNWQVPENHPVYDFMISGKNFQIDPIRKDSASDRYYKYAYARYPSGEFVQIGLSADKVYELTDRFCPHVFLSAMKDDTEVLDVQFLNHGNAIQYCSHNPLFSLEDVNQEEAEAVKSNQPYYFVKKVDDKDVFEAILPIFVDDQKVGTLITTYSLDNTNHLIKTISLITLGLLLLVFAIYFIMMSMIISKNKKIGDLAYKDDLTGYLNKNYLIDFIESGPQQKPSKNNALLIIHLDNLNLVKLIYGHKALDQLILEKSQNLLKLPIENKTYFRYSENDFLIYIKDYQDDQWLNELCQEILLLLNESTTTIESKSVVSHKIGVLRLNQNHQDSGELFKNIEIVINKLSEALNSQLYFFDDAMEEDTLLGENIEAELRKIDNNDYSDEFYMVFQPMLDLKTHKIVAFEALARWESQTMGFISPMKFIDIAEKTQLIAPLGDWILRESCRFLKKLEKKGYTDIRVAINISVAQLLQDSFVDNFLRIVRSFEVDIKNIELEITETVLSHDYTDINKKLSILSKMGVNISLDDFGTGYSSLSRLKNLSIDIIKIDQSFINSIHSSDQDDVFINSIIALAGQLNLTVVAEGVETQEQKDYLHNINCDIIQGYLFSRPLSENDAILLLRDTN